MNLIFKNIFGKFLKGKANKNLNKKFKNLNFPGISLRKNSNENIGVVQIKYNHLEKTEFVDLIYSITSQAYEKNAGILFFPGGLQYVLFPALKENPRYVKYFTENHLEDFIKIFSKMAEGFGMNIFTGEFYLYENDEIMKCGMVFDSFGKISYFYKRPIEKLELPPIYGFNNFNFAFLTFEETLMYEMSKLSVIKGANVLVNCSIGNISPYRYCEYRGIWSRCQQFKVFGINATMVGETPWGYSAIPSGLYGPVEFFKDGIIATSTNLSGTEIVVGKFSLESINFSGLEYGNLNKLMKTLKL
ncbi:MAG: deaminated glutathione amidase [Thermotogaceae bacterium]|nr:deaminated glutathione amidase [Thermotogaceae bacterium]